ncbi:DUF5803 family protein [Halanaeroarchaeum sulfurireducens]|uniref:Lipoprotein n=1 Tax=Halanaeroarchaeum sulfurireducens TaxID=1604004 RepID=A0A0F7P955_9EURY|nr:DUF5803 family protein [Halanaeroarchaeum sulfurireducens]AKH97661.1 hypothetical protein HLASF_1174 [Halanaeroarchaeum sulfurireducens]
MRRTLAIVGLVGLVFLAGCGGTAVDDAALNESAEYDWNTTEAVTITVEHSEYRYVYTLDDDSEVRLALRDELLGTQPVSISAVKFRYQNGTVANASALSVEEQNKHTVVTFPESAGQFAYTASSPARSLTVPVVTNRSHEVRLPPDMRISLPVFGGANPSGFESANQGERVVLTWSSIESDRIEVDYYQERDLLLFAGLLGVLVLVAGAGVAYYRSRLRRLQEERIAAGFGVDDER